MTETEPPFSSPGVIEGENDDPKKIGERVEKLLAYKDGQESIQKIERRGKTLTSEQRADCSEQDKWTYQHILGQIKNIALGEYQKVDPDVVKVYESWGVDDFKQLLDGLGEWDESIPEMRNKNLVRLEQDRGQEGREHEQLIMELALDPEKRKSHIREIYTETTDPDKARHQVDSLREEIIDYLAGRLK